MSEFFFWMGKLLEVFPVQSATQVEKPNALGSISVHPSRPGEELYLVFAKISKGIKMCCVSNCQRTWSRMIKSHCRESNSVLLRRSSAGLSLNLPRVTHGALAFGWAQHSGKRKMWFRTTRGKCRRARGKRLWRREDHSQPCAEPGRAHPWNYPNIRTRKCLWNRLPCSSGYQNRHQLWMLGREF